MTVYPAHLPTCDGDTLVNGVHVECFGECVTAAAQAVANAADFGRPSAHKTGRDARWPYVPVVVLTDHGVKDPRTSQVLGVAFATRDEAVAYAAAHIAQVRRVLASKLADPRYRALRVSYGLPAEIVVLP